MLLHKVVESAWGCNDELTAGAAVQLHSLKTAKLNDAGGTIIGEQQGDERWPVKLGSGKLVTVKPCNLRCSTTVAAAIESVMAEWEAKTRRDLENQAQISAELQAAAAAERVLPTDAAFATLHKKVSAAVRAGAPLQEAVAAALRAWKRQLVRNQVQQTVWDPSANSIQVSGVVQFMPFKRERSEGLDYEMLVSIFRLLSFRELAAASLVCRRWHSVASDASWQEEVLLYAWGAAELSGLAAVAPQPVMCGRRPPTASAAARRS